MDGAIFEFNSDIYGRPEVESFTRAKCEILCNEDEENVTKYNVDNDENGIQKVLNEYALEPARSYYRVFI